MGGLSQFLAYQKFIQILGILANPEKSKNLFRNTLLKLYPIMSCCFVCIIFGQVIPSYIAGSEWLNKVDKATDKFTFVCFVSVSYLQKVVQYAICVAKYKSVYKVGRLIANLDNGHVSFFSAQFFFLLIGSVLSFTSTFIVIKNDIRHLLQNSSFKSNAYFLVNIATSMTSWVGGFSIILWANVTCETAFVSFSSIFVYYVRVVICRIKCLANLVTRISQGPTKNAVKHKFLRKHIFMHFFTSEQTNHIMSLEENINWQKCLQLLHQLIITTRAVDSLGNEFILIMWILSVLLLVTVVHVSLVTLMIGTASVGGWGVEIVARQIFALSVVMMLAFLRVVVITEVGQQLKIAVSQKESKYFLTYISSY